jgi:hypothetical protein
MKPCCKTVDLGVVLLLVCGAFARAENIYVSDSSGGAILQFDSSGGESVFTSGLDKPAGLAFGKNGDLYVAESDNGTVLQFDSRGNGSVFASGLDNPAGLAFDGTGNLYVANSGAGTIMQYNVRGHGSVFASGLNLPAYLTFDNNGNLYASTPHAIEEFDSGGNHSTIFSCLNYIYGLAFDSTGNLFASLQNVGSVVGLNGRGIVFGNPFTACPAGLVFDVDNNLYVTLGETIEEFDSYGGTTQSVQETNGYVFASGLGSAEYIAIQPVPETSSCVITFIGIGAVLISRRLQQRQASLFS